ncbi:hypothetical protein GCM10029992_06850 [Glycomyces albus]
MGTHSGSRQRNGGEHQQGTQHQLEHRMNLHRLVRNAARRCTSKLPETPQSTPTGSGSLFYRADRTPQTVIKLQIYRHHPNEAFA